MANPRQRRKARSGKPKATLSKFANSKLKKVTPRNFPGALENSYNPRQTPRQNYERLGLLSGKLDPRLAGGIEKNTDLQNIWLNKYKKKDEFEILRTTSDGEVIENEDEDTEDEESDEDNSMNSTESEQEPPTVVNRDPKLAKGEGRIIRDASGKIVKVVIGDDAEIELEPTTEDPAKIVIERNLHPSTSTPWGNPLDMPTYEQAPCSADHQPAPTHQGIGYQNPRRGVVAPKTKFVEELEKISSNRLATYTETLRQKQHLSDNQTDWLLKLIEKHGLDNTHSMARDLKLNKDQKTEGELRRLISKLASE
ncbi:hypothetical protein Pst134EA_002856 [Puccinia striiformis f. sp. tritici]|uniref:hypothetical protein n=1 Tax=Puccinia striiformis f. sp. tritici TaxID=168172 RepID=UPI0020073CB7|nr:hypothetical protein Pst134EA_002856 [Puccinia striiformis f. sp. tritici]KAH9472232.1 hypothetical protein Pst134EA_002856 [Puccinia striiformis f. sp. tritici]